MFDMLNTLYLYHHYQQYSHSTYIVHPPEKNAILISKHMHKLEFMMKIWALAGRQVVTDNNLTDSRLLNSLLVLRLNI